MLNEDHIIDIWTGLKEFFDKKQIETVASKYVDVLADNGVQEHVFKAAIGGDEDLDAAIEYYLDDWDGDSEDEVDYDSQDYDED
jgi:hypothetical protein